MTKVLIANRGEIARRVIRTCKRLGFDTVAICSQVDLSAPHVQDADEYVLLSGAESAQTYLNIDRVIAAAKDSGATAIHPGYGFLSENPTFAQEVAKAGITFVGPSGPVIELLGDKVRAKALADEVGVPTVPSHSASSNSPLTEADVKAFGDKVGFPILLKAAAGGGGRGMRMVHEPEDVADAMLSARREAKVFFGDETIFVEKLVTDARHIEVQALADSFGTVKTFFERDCSLQRNHQKVIEEAPANLISPETRAKLHAYSEQLLARAQYANAGTVEFLVDADENIYFLEVNSRLQVEHPVTEMITGIDLVELQLRVALGEKLDDCLPEPVESYGHAIELRLCAEKPHQDFQASTGQITHLTFPQELTFGTIRVDSGVVAGSRISHYYDSLIAKVILHSDSREAAIEAARESLQELHLTGVETNASFLSDLLEDEAFRDGEHHTKSVDKLLEDRSLEEELWIAAAMLSALSDKELPTGSPVYRNTTTQHSQNFQLKLHGKVFTARLKGVSQTSCTLHLLTAEKEAEALLLYDISRTNSGLHFSCDNAKFIAQAEWSDDTHCWIQFGGHTELITREWSRLKAPTGASALSDNTLRSPLPGKILDICTKQGEDVATGEKLVVLESMKMEHPLNAPIDGKVQELLVAVGDVIEADTPLISFAE